MNTFLHNETYAYYIALIAITFQSIITILMSTILIVSPEEMRTYLWWLLILDTIFIMIHLTYRLKYKGVKVQLIRKEKMLISIHILASVLALLMLYFVLTNLSSMSSTITYITLSLWIISLITGIWFFIRKYFI